jgi:hypothetical protein
MQSTQRLVRAVQDLSLARDIAAIATIVRTAARELTGAQGATFVLREGEECHYVDEDAIAPLWKGQRFPLSACISGWVMLNGTPAVVPDIYADPRVPVDLYRPTFVRSLVVVPVRERSPIGAVGNYWAAMHEPTAQEVELLQALANTAAVALENVRVYSELEERVRRRTEQLEIANRELDAFSHSVSHDLRAPLRHLNGFSQLLRERAASALDPRSLDYLSRIEGAATRMATLIDDLLAFARLSRSTLKATPVNLNEIVGEARAEVVTELNERIVEWHMARLPTVHGDRALLRQVMVNLLSNAVKYTRGRTPARIEIGTIPATGEEVIFFVRDNGVGFDQQYAGRLFGVFQRLHRADEFEGTGIGLANVRRIVHRHGGRTWAAGKLDEGATFYCALPLQAGDA